MWFYNLFIKEIGYTWGTFPTFFLQGRQTSYLTFCFSAYQVLVYSERKEFAPTESKSLPIIVDPFPDVSKDNSSRAASPESISMPLNHSPAEPG